MKKYEAYKNSGVEWIGEIPEGWSTNRIKFLFSFGRGLNITKADLTETGAPVISYGQIHSKQNTGTSIEEHLLRYIPDQIANEHQECKVKIGDFIFADTSEDKEGCGNCVYVDRKGIFAGYHSLVIDGKGNDNKYFAYLFKSENWRAQIRSKASGVKVFSITQSIMSNSSVLLPSKEEQRAIASYLDHKVGQIDASVSAINTQIEDLKAYRQSIISEAVTKGLNPDVAMKDSGIEWIGEIPEGWNVLCLKRIASVQTGTTPSTTNESYWKSPDIDWFAPGDFSDYKVYLSNSKRKISSIAKKDNACRIFPANTVMMVGIGATLGKIGLSLNESSANQQINAIICDDGNLPLYVAYFLQSIRHFICSKSNSATLPILNQTETGELPIAIPPLSEQQAIASYLDAKTAKIDTTIKSLEAQRDDLNALRQSIISEAVTGKIDVRNWKPNND